jgi:uncharacterized sulfatase
LLTVRNPEEWVRLQAVIVLDELGEEARTTLPELLAASKDVENKYVVRVATHALNRLSGTATDAR